MENCSGIPASGSDLEVGAVGAVVVGCTSTGFLQVIDTVFEGVEAGVPVARMGKAAGKRSMC